MTWSQLVIHSQSSCKPPSLLAPAPLPACPPDSSNCLPVCLICLHAKSQSAHLCTSSALLLTPPSRSVLLSPPVSVPSRTVPPFVELHRKETIRKEGEREERREQRKKNKNNRRRTHCPVVPSRVAVAARVCQVRSRPACYCTLRKKDNRKKKSEKKRRVETRTKNIRRLAH